MTGYDTIGPLSARMAIHRYGTNPVPWYDFVRALLPPGRVLEVGAGTGALWADDRPEGLVVSDLSPAMCATLRDAGLTTVRATAEALPFRDRAFDGVVCNHVLYHLPDPAAGVRELRRVARDWAAVATNGYGHMVEIAPRAAAAVHEVFPAERLADALGEQFSHVELHPYVDELLVPTADPVVAYAESTGDTVDRAYVEAVIARDGAYRVTKSTVLALAR